MNVGQRVLLIGPVDVDVNPPPIGAVGEITEALDEDGDYMVLFPDYPCPSGPEPDWYVAACMLIPIDDGGVNAVPFFETLTG